MSDRLNLGRLAVGLGCALLALGTANASTVSYSGTFTGDDQVQLYSYSLSQSSDVIFQTNSYGGGISNGVTVPAGGFVPVISLFNSTGVEIASDGGDATCYAGMGADSSTGMCDDALLNKTLAAGSYTVALTEFFNVPVGPNLSDGFLEQGQGNFTGSTCGTTGAFYETDTATCSQRTGNFSLNITATPEPSTLWLGAIPLIAFGIARRRTRQTQN